MRSSSHEAMTLPRRHSSVTAGGRTGTGRARARAAALVSALTSRSGEAGAGVVEEVEALGVGGHDPVLDPVVDHLHEVAGARRAAVEIALLGRRRLALAPGVRGAALDTGRERAEERIEVRDGVVRAADHQAVARARGPTRRRSCRSRRSGCPPGASSVGAADVVADTRSCRRR